MAHILSLDIYTISVLRPHLMVKRFGEYLTVFPYFGQLWKQIFSPGGYVFFYWIMRKIYYPNHTIWKFHNVKSYRFYVILAYTRGFSGLKILFSHTAHPRTNFLISVQDVIYNKKLFPKTGFKMRKYPKKRKNAMYFIVMNYATFPKDLHELLTLIIIPIQVAQWIAIWTSVSNRIRGYVFDPHSIWYYNNIIL